MLSGFGPSAATPKDSRKRKPHGCIEEEKEGSRERSPTSQRSNRHTEQAPESEDKDQNDGLAVNVAHPPPGVLH